MFQRPLPLRYHTSALYLESARESDCKEIAASAKRFYNMVRGWNVEQCTEADRANYREWMERCA